MILLPYRLEIFWQEHDFKEPRTLHMTASDFRQELDQTLYLISFHTLMFEFHNGEHCCLRCRFTEQTYDMDWSFNHYQIDSNYQRADLYRDIIDRIESELMQYEREEFTYREIAL